MNWHLLYNTVCRFLSGRDTEQLPALSSAQPHAAQAPVLCVIHALYSWTLTWKECRTHVILSFLAPFHFMAWLIFQIQCLGFTPDLSSHVLPQ